MFALGFSDFLCCFTVLAFSSLYISNVLNNFSIIEPLALNVVMGYAAALFYDISQDVTAFISLQRCLCVALPIRFKDLFTLRRSMGIMLWFYVLTTVAYTPHFRTCGLYLRLDASRNLSIPALWQTDDRGESIFWLNYILHIGVDTFYQLVVVVSAAVMITGLEKSSKFHNKTRRNTKQHYVPLVSMATVSSQPSSQKVQLRRREIETHLGLPPTKIEML